MMILSKVRRFMPGWVVGVLVGGGMLALAASARAQSEDGLKAAFLYNFAKLTEWPAKAFASASAPITVGFVGATPLADTFEQNTKGKNVNGRDFVVKKAAAVGDCADCQIVFVADHAQIASVTTALKGKPVLIVGDVEGLLASGGMINFIKDGAKVAFELNLDAAKASEIKLDAKLQKIAKSVKGG